jgi:DNA invertase Pin-like site-specific DNA recombinase
LDGATYDIVRRYELDDSAWNGGKGLYQATLQRALDGAYRGEYQALVVWSCDRLTRGGAEDLLRLVRQFRERGCIIVSLHAVLAGISAEED